MPIQQHICRQGDGAAVGSIIETLRGCPCGSMRIGDMTCFDESSLHCWRQDYHLNNPNKGGIMETLLKKLSSGSSKTARAVVTLALAISSLPIVSSGASAQTATSTPATAATANESSMSPSTTNDSPTPPSTPSTGNDSSVRSPTSTRTEVRSPTSTSTEAYTAGNVTVTGGAGDGDTSVNIYTSPKPDPAAPAIKK
jgi:hypothetical protein